MKIETKTTEQSKNRTGILARILILALPIILQNFASFAAGFMNNMMAATLGKEVNCGVYLGNQAHLFLQIFASGIDGTIILLATRRLCSEKKSDVQNSVASGIQFSLAFGILLTTICFFAPEFVLSIFTKNRDFVHTGSSYLKILSLSFPFYMLTGALISAQRSCRNTKAGLYIISSFLIFNGVLNYILIYGKFSIRSLGADGAAYATLISRILESAVTFLYTARQKELKIRFSDIMLPKPAALKDFFKIGAPVILAQSIWGANTLFSSAVMGRLGALATESYSVSIALNNFSYSIALGLSAAIGIEIGSAIGKNEKRLANLIAKRAQFAFVAIGLITSILIILLKPLFILIYSPNSNTKAIIDSFVLLLAILAPFTAYQSVCISAIIKNGGDTLFILKTEAFSVLLIFALSLLGLRLSLCPIFMLFILKSDQILKCVPASLKVNRGQWICPLSDKKTPLRHD